MFHLLAVPGALRGDTSYETDRARFIGRGRTAANPLAFAGHGPSPLSNTQGPVLDPVVAIRRTVTVPVDDSVTLQVVSGVAETRESALALIENTGTAGLWSARSRWPGSKARRCSAYSMSPRRMPRSTAASPPRSSTRTLPGGPPPASSRATNSVNPDFGGSGSPGDLPIVLVRIGDVTRIDLVRQALQAHAYWRIKGLVRTW